MAGKTNKSVTEVSKNIKIKTSVQFIGRKDENIKIIRDGSLKAIEDLNKIRKYATTIDNTTLEGYDQKKLRDELINVYIDTIHYLMLTPTIVKLTTLSFSELDSIMNEIKIVENDDNELNTKDVFIFMYTFLYVNLSNVDVRIQDFLKSYDNEINNDTTNYKIYLNSKSNYKYIYVKRLMSILNDLILNPNKQDASVEKMKDTMQIYIIDYLYFTKAFHQLVNILESSLNINRLRDVLNKVIRDKIKNNVLTYVKIRNNEKSDYNKRFGVYTDMDDRMMLVNYNDDNDSYYKKNDNGDIDIVKNDKTNEFINVNGNLTVKKYDHTYALGPFTRVFNQQYNNQDIAKNIPEVIDSLKNLKPVFIIGYGASGAGKTSSLIYFNKKKEDGVLVDLCNIMGNNGFINIELKTYEFYQTNALLTVKNPQKQDTLNFTYLNSKFVLDKDYTHNNNHYDRVNLLFKSEGSESDWNFDDKTNTTVFPKNSALGEVIIHFIDRDRFVKATTNNPNSSRSHTLIFINLKSGNKTVNLIVGDFAGVENVFDCDDDIVISKFLNIKSDIDKTEPFYANNQEIENKNEMSKGCELYIKSKDDLYIFNENTPIKNNSEVKDYSFNVVEYNTLQLNIVNQLLSTNVNFKDPALDSVLLNKYISMGDVRFNNGLNILLTIIDVFDSIYKNYINLSVDEREKNKKALTTSKILSVLMEKLYPDDFKKIIFSNPESKSFKLRELVDNKSKIKVDEITKKLVTFFEKNVKPLVLKKEVFIISSNSEKVLTNIIDIIKSFKPEYLEKIRHIIRTLPIIFSEKTCKLNYGRDICKIRKNEGIMINNSLTDIRNLIKQILFEKNKSSIDVSPEFIESCLKSYCTDDSCFVSRDSGLSRSEQDKIKGSLIFNTIANELALSKTCLGNGKSYPCLNLVIGVFCVLNLEKTANNPPPVPYIDINNLRYELNHYNKNSLKKESIFINHCKNLIKRIEYYGDKVNSLIITKEYKTFKDIMDKDLYPSLNENAVISAIINILNEIDKINAASAMGTLQFVDVLAKYNTAEMICTDDNEYNYNPIKTFKESYLFKDVVTGYKLPVTH